MNQEFDSLKDWIGRSESQVDQVTASAVHRLAAMLDRADPLPRPGDPLPPGWYSILFPRVVPQSEIGADGHPRRGDFLPPVPPQQAPGDFICVPPQVPHREINASDREALSCVPVSSGQEPSVVNLDIAAAGQPEAVHWVDNIHPAPDSQRSDCQNCAPGSALRAKSRSSPKPVPQTRPEAAT